MSERPYLRLVENNRLRLKPLLARITVNREHGAYGRSREFVLSEHDLRELIDTALRLERRQ